jgi:hypothetical protein
MAFMSVVLFCLIIGPVLGVVLFVWSGLWAYAAFGIVLGALLMRLRGTLRTSEGFTQWRAAGGGKALACDVVSALVSLGAWFYLITGVISGLAAAGVTAYFLA